MLQRHFDRPSCPIMPRHLVDRPIRESLLRRRSPCSCSSCSVGGRTTAQPQSNAGSALVIGQQMEALWQGKCALPGGSRHRLERAALSQHSGLEGAGWFAKPRSFAGGAWYLFSRHAIPKPSYCPGSASEVVVRTRPDEGRTWSNLQVVVAAPGRQWRTRRLRHRRWQHLLATHAAADTWHMLAWQCLAAYNAGGWSMCRTHTRRGASPMGRFVADGQPAVTTGELRWSQICADSHADLAIPAPLGARERPISSKRETALFLRHLPRLQRTARAIAASPRPPDFHNWSVAGTRSAGRTRSSALTECAGLESRLHRRRRILDANRRRVP